MKIEIIKGTMFLDPCQNDVEKIITIPMKRLNSKRAILNRIDNLLSKHWFTMGDAYTFVDVCLKYHNDYIKDSFLTMFLSHGLVEE